MNIFLLLGKGRSSHLDYARCALDLVLFGVRLLISTTLDVRSTALDVRLVLFGVRLLISTTLDVRSAMLDVRNCNLSQVIPSIIN